MNVLLGVLLKQGKKLEVLLLWPLATSLRKTPMRNEMLEISIERVSEIFLVWQLERDCINVCAFVSETNLSSYTDYYFHRSTHLSPARSTRKVNTSSSWLT